MPREPHVHAQRPYPLHAPEGHATHTPDGKTTSTGQPRAGEDEPESTRDNDERVEATSHKGKHQDQAGCDEHATDHAPAKDNTPEQP
ncbi:hypothetical protein KOEU_18620 [Komagataeibacter europaeus]|uniref:Uncharacterized protein n=1 Tax=Komagataeibacter europaeus TaxID=33995 RepID=A0A0M0EHA8_KOMEU|nr:hypothetical protein [Komagataeibacter europaeus]KON64647.1 hypothetical protein KOEU_18620 [Komagataeibacter europaeus]GBQ47605.1 hypothetical protein AA18890_2801 [Komagataeibacter europaeus LMG 18890]